MSAPRRRTPCGMALLLLALALPGYAQNSATPLDLGGAAASAHLVAVTVNPSSVVAGGSAVGAVTLDAPAPAGGALVALSSSNPLAAMLPPSALVPAGDSAVTFTV